MVSPVLAVPAVSKIRRKKERTAHSNTRKGNSGSPFAQILSQSIDESKTVSLNCHTITYGRDSMITAFQYQTKEYTY